MLDLPPFRRNQFHLCSEFTVFRGNIRHFCYDKCCVFNSFHISTFAIQNEATDDLTICGDVCIVSPCLKTSSRTSKSLRSDP